MTIILPRNSTSLITEPTSSDYNRLGITTPDHTKSGIQAGYVIQAPTQEEVMRYTGADISVGIPLVKRGFLVNTLSPLHVPSNEDLERLGIEVHSTLKRSYSVEDGVAYVSDPNVGYLRDFKDIWFDASGFISPLMIDYGISAPVSVFSDYHVSSSPKKTIDDDKLGVITRKPRTKGTLDIESLMGLLGGVIPREEL
jgi:hypothetical protein